VFSKQLDERYDDKIKRPTDIAAQDSRLAATTHEVDPASAELHHFEGPGKPSPLRVEIAEDEVSPTTPGDAILERWYNHGCKNHAVFFFFEQL